MLTGKAKTEYQREYMRRKRAGLPTATKPKPEAVRTAGVRTPQWLVDRIMYWRTSHYNRETGRRVIAGLGTTWTDADGVEKCTWTEADMVEACRRYWAIVDERPDKQEAAKPPERRCAFCDKPRSAVKQMVGDDYTLICDSCFDEIAALFAAARR